MTVDPAPLDPCSAAVPRAAEKLTPPVVNIDSRHASPVRRRAPDQNPERGGSGSGFVFTPDGFILTNSHVVGGAASGRRGLAGGRSYDAQRIGDDPETDLPVLRAGAEHLISAQ